MNHIKKARTISRVVLAFCLSVIGTVLCVLKGIYYVLPNANNLTLCNS